MSSGVSATKLVRPRGTSQTASRLLVALFTLALLVTSVAHINQASARYTYRHGFISAVFATSARNFARFGILGLGGVPVDNNPPITSDDSYVHWPPLFPATLSILFRLFGVSETVAHLWMLAIAIGTALMVFAVARDWLGISGGALAGSLWLATPVVVHYSQVVVPESLAILLMLVSTYAFQRARPWLAASAAFLAACTSWEAALIPAGLWLGATVSKRRSQKRLAALCALAAVLALLLIGGCYASHSPALVRDAVQTALFRMGLSDTYSKRPIVDSVERYIGLGESIGRILVNFPRMLGIFGAAALVLLALSRPKGSGILLYALGTPWLAWCILMRNHMAAHDIEMDLAAPLAAIALAWVGLAILEQPRTVAKACASGVIAMAVALQPWVLGTEKSPEDPVQIIGFSDGIRRATSSNAIVLSPLISAIPLYYSERHLIRCIPDEMALRRVLPYVRQEYPEAPLYWATPLYREPWVVVKEIRR
jgi:hypothetical protein